MTSKNFQLDLKDLFLELWAKKWLFIAIVCFFSVTGVVYSLSLPNIYKAEVLVSPNDADSQMQSLVGQLGGIAALTGINVGSGMGDKTAFGLEVLRSRVFSEKFIEKREILAPLMALDTWDSKTNSITYDESLYDEKNKKWVRVVKPPKQSRPSAWEAHKVFNENLNFEKVRESGFIRISFQSKSPELASQWVEWIIADLNHWLKIYDIEEVKRNIYYLNEQLAKTNVAEMHKIFYQLIEEQTKKLMLAEAQSEYAFKVVDPAVIPEEKNSPRRALICILFAFLGTIFAVFIILLNYLRKR
ncbi:Wzz/FepE/Etk N-terminal domain-containing protein [uncultured Shewanella sp.]|uniref:Wzz/FepE/Etk N-terminal domain-containing protein n=1 Tax=uncultured Shewanella sp. TaxID=173975 RepID=UPI00261C967B|nr:Wzz/FepE/Etk N-terminal domain-containing protein [uncultured Shewanella sp.]